MVQPLVTALLWFAAIGCGLLGGLYYAFSAFIMSSFGRIEQSAGVSAMNAINTVILKSSFMPLFLGTTLASLLLAIFGVLRWSEPGAAALVAGGIVYVLGMFVVTMAFNVPLNNALAAVDPAGAAAGEVWARYLKDWTLWNHVRTVASTLASGLFIAALLARA